MSTYVLAQPLGPVAYGGVPRTWSPGQVFDDRYWNVATLIAAGAQFEPRTVRVNATGANGAEASPYVANPLDTVVADTSLGSVVVDVPVLAAGMSVRVKHDENTTLAANTVTVNAPAGVAIAEPPPNNGTFVASYVFGGAGGGGQEARGSDFTWVNLGSAAGYSLE